MVNTIQTYNKCHSVRLVLSELAGKDTLIHLSDSSDSRDFTFNVFQYGVVGHFWAAIYDFKVKMVSENIKNHSVTFLMQEITEHDTLFDFFVPFVSRDTTFLVFNMASAAILDSHLEFES